MGRLLKYLIFYVTAFVCLFQRVQAGDVVVAKTDPPLISVLVLGVARLRGAKLVNWLQDLYPDVAIALGVLSSRSPIASLLTRFRNKALKSAAANVVIGNRMAARLGRDGVRENHIRIVPNWCDDCAITPIDAAMTDRRREWGFANSDFILGYSGNLGRAHEAETLLAAARLLKDRRDIYFLFVGGGYESQKLMEAVESEGLTNFVFKAHQPKDSLKDSLGAADAHWLSLRPELEGLIVPSKFFGIAAAGRPVIAVVSPEGEIAEVVAGAQCGIVVKPGDPVDLARAIVALADDPVLRRAMGTRARDLIEGKFSRELALQRWEEVLLEVTSAPYLPDQASSIPRKTAEKEYFGIDHTINEAKVP